MSELGLDEVRRAAERLAGQVVRTPVVRSAALDAVAGAELWLKAECMQHIGAFKARGALHAVGRLDHAARARGVLTYSSGNHAQAVALAAQRYGVPCWVAMPVDAPQVKLARVRALGAEVTLAGHTSADRYEAALAIQARTGAAMIPPFDHPDIIAGQGTATLELCDEAEGAGAPLAALLVPVGGGGLVAGACLAAASRGVKIYSVEPIGNDALAQSMEVGRRVTIEPGPTIADGLRPVQVGELNFAIAQRDLAGSLRVGDEEIGRALVTLLLEAKVLVEPSGAAALAAALYRKVPGAPKRVGVILSGGNVGPADLARLLTTYPPLGP